MEVSRQYQDHPEEEPGTLGFNPQTPLQDSTSSTLINTPPQAPPSEKPDQPPSLEDDPPTTQPPPTGWREPLFILTLCSTQLFVQGALGYILVPLPLITPTYALTPLSPSRSWLIAGYSLTVGTFILPFGTLGDTYGHRRLLVAGYIWFGVFSLIGGFSAFSHSVIFFSVVRALQGIGPAVVLPNSLAILGRTYEAGSKKKRLIFALFALGAPLGFLVGAVVGAVFAEWVWWPWGMWVYGIACFVVAGVGAWVVPGDTVPWRGKNGARFDWLGSGLGVAGLLLLNISWNQAPLDGWSAPWVIVLLILGFVCLGLFVLQERRTEHPLLDLRIFNRHVGAVLLVTGLGWSSFGIWFYYLFQVIQEFRRVSAIESAAQVVPEAISGMLAAIATPYMLSSMRTGWVLAISCFAFLAGCILQATAPVNQIYWFNTFWSFVIMAWGMDISFPASATILSDAVPVEHQGVSASLVNTVVNYSIAIGLGIAGTVEAQVNPDGQSVLSGYQSALYTSVGLAGLAFGVSMVYAACTSMAGRRKRTKIEDIFNKA